MKIVIYALSLKNGKKSCALNAWIVDILTLLAGGMCGLLTGLELADLYIRADAGIVCACGAIVRIGRAVSCKGGVTKARGMNGLAQAFGVPLSRCLLRITLWTQTQGKLFDRFFRRRPENLADVIPRSENHFWRWKVVSACLYCNIARGELETTGYQ